MIRVKVSHPWVRWPLKRQSPGGSGDWQGYRFLLNEPVPEADAWLVLEDLARPETCRIPPGRTVLLLYEWHYIKPKYPEAFIRQFDAVYTYRPDRPHPRTIHRWLPLPWFHGVPLTQGHQAEKGAKSLEQYRRDTMPEKPRLLSVISSSKALCEGHQLRLRFIKALQAAFPGQIDVFGSGIREIRDKAEAIDPYRYHIVLENGMNPDGWTEKLADCFLGRAHPFYWGCPNLQGYFPKDSFTPIPIEDPARAIRIIREAIAADVFSRGQAGRESAREMILDRYNLFAGWREIAGDLGHEPPSGQHPRRHLRPESHFSGSWMVRWRARFRDWFRDKMPVRS